MRWGVGWGKKRKDWSAARNNSTHVLMTTIWGTQHVHWLGRATVTPLLINPRTCTAAAVKKKKVWEAQRLISIDQWRNEQNNDEPRLRNAALNQKWVHFFECLIKTLICCFKVTHTTDKKKDYSTRFPKESARRAFLFLKLEFGPSSSASHSPSNRR